MQYTKNDIFILNGIKVAGGVSELASVPVTTIEEKTNLSHTKIRATLKMLISDNYIQEGFMQKNAKTYFITDTGEQLLDRLLGGRKNVK